ncbi:replication termination factor 2 [Daktulosphaira vitifoliae]|uniref:replication termination factor 2 n=1 Tax=Daktulosphaira vitifoliae TaxID=58002 RepID=UPI0021AA5CD6|nr:replication termination factor 2 [Daktulosphaira vitifoliae]
MGCDGGTIPKRDELVRTKKKPEQKDKSSEQLFRWRNCHLTQEALRSPIVACGMGLLYNKESILQHLLNKTPLPECSIHIKNLKDIKEIKFTANPAFKGKAQSVGGYTDNNVSPYICPLIGLEVNDRSKFCFLWNCGCVISERGLKLGADNKCVNCTSDYVDDDIVILNPSEDDINLMKQRLVKRKEKLKSKKNKSKEIVIKKESNESIDLKDVKPQIIKPDSIKIEFKNINVKLENKSEETKRKLEPSFKKEQNKKALYSASSSSTSTNSCCRKLEDPVYKKAKLSHSIAKDESATNVFKSLFTSHEDDKKQTRAHWITYNPFYN